MDLFDSVDISFARVRDQSDVAVSYLHHIIGPALQVECERSALYGTSLALLLDADATIALASNGALPVAGLHMVVDGSAVCWFQGVRVIPDWRGRGLASFLIRSSMVWAVRHRDLTGFALSLRCKADGSPYGSYTAYQACGFIAAGPPYDVMISGTEVDLHLGAPGSVFKTMKMVARPDSVRIAMARLQVRSKGGLQ